MQTECIKTDSSRRRQASCLSAARTSRERSADVSSARMVTGCLRQRPSSERAHCLVQGFRLRQSLLNMLSGWSFAGSCGREVRAAIESLRRGGGSKPSVPSTRWLAIVGSLLLGLVSVFAAEPLTLRSHSGQFVVRGLPVGVPLFNGAPTSGVTYLRLDPAALVVSCERIKDALSAELAWRDHWRGQIYISLHPVREDNEPISITQVRHPEGWSYHVEIPEMVDRARLLKAMVQVLFAEMVHRHAGPREVELPPWLVEGMAAYLQATARSSLMLEPRTSIVRSGWHQDPLLAAREKLRTALPLTLNELNWPSEEQLSGAAEVYAVCAHVFVHELLRLKNGRACLREMLLLLPETLNWQVAFLRAFQVHFPRLIDVDKWWALNVVHITGRDLTSVLTREETIRQLDEVLAMPVQVRHQPEELPLTTQAKLQHLIAQWEYRRQLPVLRQKLNLLQALRLRASQDLVGLVDSYRLVLDSYLQKRSKPLAGDSSKGQFSSYKIFVHEALKRLDELDMQREALRRQKDPPIAAKSLRRDHVPPPSRQGFGTVKP